MEFFGDLLSVVAESKRHRSQSVLDHFGQGEGSLVSLSNIPEGGTEFDCRGEPFFVFSEVRTVAVSLHVDHEWEENKDEYRMGKR